MTVVMIWLAQCRACAHLYHTLSLLSFPISLSIHPPLSFIRSLILVLYSSSSAYLFPLSPFTRLCVHPSPQLNLRHLPHPPLNPSYPQHQFCLKMFSFILGDDKNIGHAWIYQITHEPLLLSSSPLSLSLALYFPPLARSIHACQQGLLYHVDAPRLKAN